MMPDTNRYLKYVSDITLHNEELHDLYSSPSIIRIIKSGEDEMGGPCSANGGEEELL
jgi:hypothetical protein